MPITPSSSVRRGRSSLIICVFVCLLGASSLCAAGDRTSSNPVDSKWRVRGRLIGIIPDDSSTRIDLEAAGAKTPLQAGVSVDAAVVPELDITYMVTPHFATHASQERLR